MPASQQLLCFYQRTHKGNRFWRHRNQLQGAQRSAEVPESTCSFSLLVPEKAPKKLSATTSSSTHQARDGHGPVGQAPPQVLARDEKLSLQQLGTLHNTPQSLHAEEINVKLSRLLVQKGASSVNQRSQNSPLKKKGNNFNGKTWCHGTACPDPLQKQMGVPRFCYCNGVLASANTLYPKNTFRRAWIAFLATVPKEVLTSFCQSPDFPPEHTVNELHQACNN